MSDMAPYLEYGALLVQYGALLSNKAPYYKYGALLVNMAPD